MALRVFYGCGVDLSVQGAATVHVTQVVANLRALGCHVDLHAPVPRTPQVAPQAHYFPQRPRNPLWQLRHDLDLARTILAGGKRGKWDVAYVRTMSLSFLVPVACRLTGLPMVAEVNGFAHAELLSAGASAPKRLLCDLAERLCYRLSARVVCVSDRLRSLVLARFRAPSQKVVTIHNGTDLSVFHPLDRKVARRRVGLPEDRLIVGFLGSFYLHHGVDLLVRAAGAVVAADPSVLFVLAGDGPTRPSVRELVVRNGLSERVLMPGRVPITSAPDWISSFDVAVHCFRGATAGCPIKVLDYMACGRPVVAGRDLEAADMIETAGAGVAVDPSNTSELSGTLSWLLHDSARREEMGQRGRALVEGSFSWRQTAEKIDEVLRAVVLEARGHPPRRPRRQRIRAPLAAQRRQGTA